MKPKEREYLSVRCALSASCQQHTQPIRTAAKWLGGAPRSAKLVIHSDKLAGEQSDQAAQRRRAVKLLQTVQGLYQIWSSVTLRRRGMENALASRWKDGLADT
ncbi:Hypothetical predicted protein [Xyrichtys novacula]|uniref:Uncharacterized protein n=1 Tax=Xyrichtys novacula TaxID=13765 RepID=A0AAV1GW32_XYRNO|nr:Hypothetical predicted protein [Xyrichtys novacula]